MVSANGIWRVLARHGLSTRGKRLALVAGYRAPYEPPREKLPEPHILSSRPGELVGIDCFFVGHLKGTKGAVWQLTGIDTHSSYGWGELVRCTSGQPTQKMTSRFARRIAKELSEAGWRLERVLTDNGNEFSKGIFGRQVVDLGATQTRIRPGRPQTNGHVERLNRTILEECWRSAFAKYLQVRFRGLEQELEDYLDYYNHQRAHTGRICRGRVPAEIVYGASKMEIK